MLWTSQKQNAGQLPRRGTGNDNNCLQYVQSTLHVKFRRPPLDGRLIPPSGVSFFGSILELKNLNLILLSKAIKRHEKNFRGTQTYLCYSVRTTYFNKTFGVANSIRVFTHFPTLLYKTSRFNYQVPLKFNACMLWPGIVS